MLVEAEAHPVTETSLSHFFITRLESCARSAPQRPQEDTLCYLGGVLDRFGRSDALFSYEDGRLLLRPLAQLYGDAREAANEGERCLLLRQLGDLALFLGALFPERYARKGIRRDYFVGMGSSAYDYLGDNARRNRHIFTELAAMFSAILDLVARALDRTERLDSKAVLALYQRWVRDKDPVAERKLRALGIEPDDTGRGH
jgi:hypothetical protein